MYYSLAVFFWQEFHRTPAFFVKRMEKTAANDMAFTAVWNIATL